MAGSLRNLFFVLAAAALTGAAGLAFAQSAPLPVPVNISPVGPAPGGLNTMATFDARGVGGASNAGYYSRPVLVSNNTLGGLARGLLRRSVPVAAMLALVEAAGWAIDELTGQVMIPGSDGDAPPAGSAVWCTTSWGASFSGTMCGPSAESFIGMSPGWPGGTYTVTGYAPQSSTAGTLIVNNGAVGGMTVQVFAYQPNTHQWLGAYPAQPVPDADLGALVRDNPHVWNDALRNPDGSVNRNPDVMQEAERLRDALLNPDPVTNPVPDPDAEWDTGYQGGEPQASPTALEFPNFCSWASVVCELADWLRLDSEGEDPDPEVPVIEPDTSVSWSSGFGGGSCPAPVSVEVMGADVDFSYQPLCDLAIYIKPIVLAAAALMAVLIIGGFRRAS